MAERVEWRHGLEARLQDLVAGESGEAALVVELMASLGHVNVRGDAQDQRFLEAVRSVLRQPLPLEPNTVSDGAHRVYWLGPDEWLLITPRDGVQALLAELEDRLQDKLQEGLWAVNDLSGGQILLRLSGEASNDVLAAGCTLDLHPAAFPPGRCAQSGLARAAVLLSPGADGCFDVVVRRSFADYLLTWLKAMAGEGGLAVIAG